MTEKLTAVVLAAGKGSRMKSRLDKVMHPLAGRPLLGHVLDTIQATGCERAVVVLAPSMEQAAGFASGHDLAVDIAIQEPALGTGHALMAARDHLPRTGTVAVLFGDTPFLEASTIGRLVRTREERGAAIAVLGMECADASGYGRLVMQGEELLSIVEEAQADAAVLAIRLGNSGVMAFDAARLGAVLDALPPRTARDGNVEYYLTDAIELARGRGWHCCVATAPEAEGLGINDRVQLAQAEVMLQDRLRERAMRGGVTMLDPASVHLSLDTRFGRDVLLEPNVFIGPGVTIEDEVRLRACTHIAVDAPKETKRIVIRQGAVVGPFARIRSGSDIGPSVRIGNFVETKNSTFAEKAKANHLAYVGDTRVGARSNIGAGTITCNYDGIAKWPTVIGEDVFIGSNATLIAPVEIGDGGFVTAASWAAGRIKAGASASARGETDIKEGGADRLRRYLQRRAGRQGP